MFVLTVLLVSCQGNMVSTSVEDGDTLSLKYAQQLIMVHHAGYTEVTIKNPWKQGCVLHQYFLVPKGKSNEQTDSAIQEVVKEKKANGVKADIIRTPVGKGVFFTSPHCQLAYDLGCSNAIAGVCDLDYINIKDIHRRAAPILYSTSAPTSHIVNCGSSMQPSIEKIIDISPEALLVSPFENSNGLEKLDKLDIPVIEAADYMETSALGRAEWILFYGMAFGREKQADSLFHAVDSTYLSLRQMAIKLAKGRSIITERKTGDVWYTPGGQSTVGMLLTDANATYPFANDRHSGSLALSSEQMIDKAESADVWAFKNFGKPLTKRDLLAEFQGYSLLRSFKTGEIYQCDTSVVPYFEETAFHPDRLLREFIQLAHPNVQLGGLRYYKKFE